MIQYSTLKYSTVKCSAVLQQHDYLILLTDDITFDLVKFRSVFGVLWEQVESLIMQCNAVQYITLKVCSVQY